MLFTQKIVTKLSKIWVWDPGLGFWKKPIPDPGVKKAQDPGFQIRNNGLELYISVVQETTFHDYQ